MHSTSLRTTDADDLCSNCHKERNVQLANMPMNATAQCASCHMLTLSESKAEGNSWVYWNTHSVMWEIIMCITLYSGVLTIEFATIVADHPLFACWPWVGKLAHQAHKLMPALAVVGACLSLLHQSSLGVRFLSILPQVGTFDKLEEAEPAKAEAVASPIPAIGQAGR